MIKTKINQQKDFNSHTNLHLPEVDFHLPRRRNHAFSH